MTRILIAYHSRSGNTAEAVRRLALILPADLEPVTEQQERRGLWAYLRAGLDALRQHPAEIAPPRYRAAEYELVVIATPNWAGRLSAPMTAWLTQEGKRLPPYAALVTQGGSGGENLIARLSERLAAAPVAQLILNEPQIVSGDYDLELERFAAEIRQALRVSEEA